MDCCSCLVLTQEFAQGAKKSSVSRTEGHGKAGLIRILFSVCVGEFRGWFLIPRDPRLDVAGRNRLSTGNHGTPGAAKPQPHDCTNERWAPKFRRLHNFCVHQSLGKSAHASKILDVSRTESWSAERP